MDSIQIAALRRDLRSLGSQVRELLQGEAREEALEHLFQADVYLGWKQYAGAKAALSEVRFLLNSREV